MSSQDQNTLCDNLGLSIDTTMVVDNVAQTTDMLEVQKVVDNKDNSATNENKSNDSQVKANDDKKVPKTEEQYDHFLKRWQIRDKASGKWVPYDPFSAPPPPPPKVDLDNYFYVYYRYDDKNDTKPDIILGHFSQSLIHFLRVSIGGQFFDSHPSWFLRSIFPEIQKFKDHLSAAHSALLSNVSGEDLRNAAKGLGCVDALSETRTGDHVRGYLLELVEHLGVFIEFLEDQYKPIGEKLALEVSYGYISYDLLLYYFKKGETYYIVNDDGDLRAFILKKVKYINGMPSYFSIEGKGLYWTGYNYSECKLEHTIEFFPETKALSDLGCYIMTEEVKNQLKDRGILYTAMSGMHYRTYEGKRIVVDRIAYDNQSGYIRTPNQVIPDLKEHKLHLLPAIVYGFDLAGKTWTGFKVQKVRPVKFDDKAWDHLVLDDDTKTLIKALVRVTRNSITTSAIINDVISGKGGGLIALLHGCPGTGKTLTAEAVAELLQRPLYMVSSAELSTQAAYLEQNLSKILKLATAWDAIILIDEADVYLEQRSFHELQRNALVSVALRLLEYHRGVLFLTTNRIKAFDEAFLSRFSVAIKYPDLDTTARLTIWQNFFQLAGCVVRRNEISEATSDSSDSFIEVDEVPQRYVSFSDLEELSTKPFNGRTIKNLVRTAQALAIASEEPLSIKHVKIVVRAQEKFLTEFAS